MRPPQTFRLGIALAFISLFSPRIAHATGILLTPDNLSEVMIEIEVRYGDLLGISIDDIKLYLDEQLQAPYDESLGTPDPQMDFQDNDFLKFSWNNVPDAIEYNAGYLNLNNGASSDYITTPPTINFEIPNDLYLFVFSGTSEFGKGKHWIIIEDKILAIVLNSDCQCRDSAEPEIFNFSSSNSIQLVEYPSDDFNLYYSGVLQFESLGSFVEANFAVSLYGENGSINAVGVPIVSSDETCMQNVTSDGTYLWGIDDSGNSPLASEHAFRFQFGGDNMRAKTLYDQYYGATLILTRCISPFDNDSDSGGYEGDGKRMAAPALEIFPNPTENEITLSLDLLDSSNQIIIRNQMGQFVKIITMSPLQKNRLTDQLTIDLSSYPSGAYFLQIQGSNEISTYKVIKL